MKQHITTEQLNELSKKGKKNIRKWWKPGRGDIYFVHDEYEIEDGLNWNTEVFEGEDLSDRIAFPSLSIGQMVEFLDEHEHWDGWVIAKDSMARKYKWTVWEFLGEPAGIGELPGGHYFELCDALWEVVKEVLEK